MNVLLISPKDPKIPTNLKYLMGGENTYTQSLLRNPPIGITYIYFQDALKKGDIQYTFWQTFFLVLFKLKILPPDVGFQCIKLNKKFDLVHSHVYGLKIDGQVRPPVVLSDSSSNYLFLRDYLGWKDHDIKKAYRFKRWVVKKFDIFDQNLNVKNAKLIVWSEFAKKVHMRLGMAEKKIIVIPPGIQKQEKKKKFTKKINILFIGIWFLRKGGDLLLSVYEKLKKKYPFISLTIVGEIPKNIYIPKEVNHKNYIPRNILINKVFPNADILVNIPPKVEGFGVVVLEASSFGIPSIVSSVCALPEIVENNKTGFVIAPKNIDQLLEALETLIVNSKLRREMGKVAKKKFQEKFETRVTNKTLLRIYQSAMSE